MNYAIYTEPEILAPPVSILARRKWLDSPIDYQFGVVACPLNGFPVRFLVDVTGKVIFEPSDADQDWRYVATVGQARAREYYTEAREWASSVSGKRFSTHREMVNYFSAVGITEDVWEEVDE